MEHRHSTRSPASIPVMIAHHEQPGIRGVTRDIGLDGMFVYVEEAGFSRHTFVEIAVPYAGSELSTLRTKAMVMRVETSGLAVCFEADARIRAHIRTLLSSHSAPDF